MKLRSAALLGATAMLAVPASAEGQTPAEPQAGAQPTTIKVTTKRLDVLAGQRAAVRGVVRPATGGSVVLERRQGGAWKRLAAGRTNAAGRFSLSARVQTPSSVPVRVRTGGAAGKATRTLGRLDVFRKTIASYYWQGQALACGGRLTSRTMGVAHKTLPCGTKVTFKVGKRKVRVPVVDRGPYVGGRTWDLTVATRNKLGFGDLGYVLSTK